MQTTVKMTLKGKTSRKWASGQNIHEFGKEIRLYDLYHVYSETSLLVYISDLK